MSMQTEQMQEMFRVVMSNGEMFSGGTETRGREIAEEWDVYGFTPPQADEWMSAGFWDAMTAERCRDAGLTPEIAVETAEKLVAREGADAFTSASPIYAICNGDYAVAHFIGAVAE